MTSKINRPVTRSGRDPGVVGLTQEWYDLGYSDALDDTLDSDSDAYDTGYAHGLADRRNSTEDAKEQLVHRLEERITRIETCLRARSEVSNRNGGTI